MPSLKTLRTRINSVKSTQKITSAMKMVAASKLRRAQSQAEAARPYAQRMERMLASLAANVAGSPTAPKLLVGTGQENVHLLVPITAERGLAGAFSSSIGRLTRNIAHALEGEGKTVKVLPVGRKGRDYLRRELPGKVLDEGAVVGKRTFGFADAEALAQHLVGMLNAGEIDVCTVVYNRFASVISQVPTEMRLIPASMPEGEPARGQPVLPDERPAPAPLHEPKAAPVPPGARASYEFEPDEETILSRLLPQNLAIQIYRAMLESSAGFYGAQMTAMDNATRNAGEMIKRLSLHYNRARQANITSELIEIISGAEAV